MTFTFGNPALQQTSGCGHWMLNFSVTTQAGTFEISRHLHRDDLTSPDPGETTRDLALFVAIIEARRIAKAAGAATLAQANVAIRNQVVVI